ncbi:MAG: RluA family pseudouridine synthase [Armatimonadetes bacterium]|nr:RluA family pseudouridine synthase [Armatimonadota bacterium]
MDLTADRTERLDRFLARSLPEHSRTRLAEHVAAGRVRVNGRPRKPGFRLEPGMTVSVEPIPDRPLQDLAPVEMPLDAVYEDRWLLVVNKPAGLAVHPSPTSRGPTLVHALLARSHSLSREGGAFRPGIVHRLDKGTSGLLLVAKTDAVHRALQTAIQQKRVRRIYRAWVRGRPEQEQFVIRCFLGRHPKHRKKRAVVSKAASDAREAVTRCRLIGSWREKGTGARAVAVSELECELETGRTHQVRVHLASVGLPVLGDPVYGVAHPGLEHPALHSARLEFKHPVTGLELLLEAPPPADLTFPAA